MASKETLQAARRLSEKFCLLGGRFLGVLDPSKKIIKPDAFKELEKQFLSLLDQSWSESEIEVVLYQAYKAGKKEAVPYKLFLGRTPLEKRKDRDRNLLEGRTSADLRFHPALAKRRMPRFRVTQSDAGWTQEKTNAGEGISWRSSFTLEDLATYWEAGTPAFVLSQSGDEAIKVLAYLLDTYTVEDILWAMDAFFKDLPDRPVLGQRALSLFDLKAYIDDEILTAQDMRSNI